MMVFGLLLTIAGAALIIVGQQMFWIRFFARIRGETIEGEIVKWKTIKTRGRSDSSASRVMFMPIVEFLDPSGVSRTIQISYQYTPLFMKEHPVGSPLSVLFDPKFPDRALDTTWTMAYFLPALLSLCGCLVLLIGLGVFWGT